RSEDVGRRLRPPQLARSGPELYATSRGAQRGSPRGQPIRVIRNLQSAYNHQVNPKRAASLDDRSSRLDANSVAVPVEHAQRPHCVPSARLARLLHLEMHFTGMWRGEAPVSLRIALLCENAKGIAHALVVADVGAAEIVQRLQDIEAV